MIVNTNGGGTETVHYYKANGERVAKKNSSGTYYILTDHLGSADVITDENGNKVEDIEYKPYGGILAGGGGENKLYTGKEKDLTGLYYYGARYYNPITTRFTQPDTVIPNVYNPQDLNRYTYVRNNPLKYVDEKGNSPLAVIGALAAPIIEGTVVGAIIGYLNYRIKVPQAKQSPSLQNAYIAAGAGAGAVGGYVGALVGGAGAGLPGALVGDAIVASFATIYTTNILFAEGEHMINQDGTVTTAEGVEIGVLSAFFAGAEEVGGAVYEALTEVSVEILINPIDNSPQEGDKPPEIVEG